MDTEAVLAKKKGREISVICTPKVRHFWRCIFFMGKTGRKNKVYSAEFKIGVIIDMREHKLGYNETIRKYWDDGLVGNHFRQRLTLQVAQGIYRATRLEVL